MKQKDFDRPKYQYWWEAEFERDFTVMRMNWLQKLMYRCLLQKAFVCDTAPHLPNDDNILWVLAGARDIEMWQQEKSSIISKFEEFESADGLKLLRHKRLEEDYVKINEVKADISEKRREAGRRGAMAKWQKAGKAMANDGK